MQKLTERFQDAVQQFWTGRDDALQRQISEGKVDAGARGTVTAGRHMSAIEALVVDLLEEAGVERPRRGWGVVVVSEMQLISDIGFKSQGGPSFGNNYNNRVEEAVGNAGDIWTAFREGHLGTSRPFLGYFFLLEDTARVHSPVTVRAPYFPTDPAFGNASYARRYAILCRRLVLERLYDATCLTLATRETPTRVSHPEDSLSFERFAAQLQGHAQGFVNATK